MKVRFLKSVTASELFSILISLLVAVFLFIFSQPNPFILNGINGFAWLMLIPVLFMISKLTKLTSFVCGFVYGVTVCILYALWLINYNVIALLLVALYEGILYAIVFYLLKLAFDLFKDYSFIIQCLIWCSFEYLRTIGFLGVNYGVIGYSQWNNPVLLQSASLFGVHGLNFIILFPSCYFTNVLLYKGDKKEFIKKTKMSIIGYSIVLISLILYGYFQLKKQYNYDVTKKICLVQNNMDTSLYYSNKDNKILNTYINLFSEKNINFSDVDLIVFPEDAVRPRVLLNEDDAIPQDMYNDVLDYLKFFQSFDVPIVFGSTCLEYDSIRNGNFTYKAYNISCFLENKIKSIPANIKIYKKRHLVPFIEKVPFVNYYNPKFYKIFGCLSPGKNTISFELNDIKFCTPICFEESFGYDVRSFMKTNPSFILSLSNDLWSKSLECQYQHLSMEVFRAVENRLPFLRSSVSGQTVYINQKGSVVEMLEPFTRDLIIVNVPMSRDPKRTLYSVIGDTAGIFFVLICALSFIYKFINKKGSGAK